MIVQLHRLESICGTSEHTCIALRCTWTLAETKLNELIAASGLGVRNSSLPFLIFGGAAIAGGCLAVLLPETRGVKLPETVAEVEEIVRRGTCTTSWLPWTRSRGRSQEDTGETRL